MAGEIQVPYSSGRTVYSIIRNRNAQVWNTSNSAFEVYNSANWADYVVSLVEQLSSAVYVGNFPSSITSGTYGIVAYQQLGGSPAAGDPFIGGGNLEWNGSNVLPISDLATSGQLGQIAPIRIARGTMVQNFPFYLVSSADHLTPFTSGGYPGSSGQVSRDGGAFGALQSGNITEIGLGWYKLNFTSGDLNANTIALYITATGVSGGVADPRAITFVTQRTSGN